MTQPISNAELVALLRKGIEDTAMAMREAKGAASTPEDQPLTEDAAEARSFSAS